MKDMKLVNGRFAESTPEAQGIPSRAIIDFLHKVWDSDSDLHSLQIFKNGYLIASAYPKPFEPWTPHRIYSAAKNISGFAMLFAIDEGLCSLDDKVIDYFPKYDTPELSPLCREMTIYDLLTMSTGQAVDPFDRSLKEGLNWQDGFFTTPVVYKPGTHFMYNNTVPYMLGVIVHRVSGLNYIDYLRPRLLDPVGIYATVELTKDGDGELEGSTTVITPESMAKLALFYLQMGKWDGKQLLSPEIVKLSSSYLVPNPNEFGESGGYGFQTWRNAYGGFMLNGGNGQIAIMIPEMDFAIVWTSWTATNLSVDFCRDTIFASIYAKPLDEDEAAKRDQAELRELLANWSTAPRNLAPSDPAEAALCCRRFVMDENRYGINAITFNFARHDIYVEQEQTIPLTYGVNGDFVANHRNIKTPPQDAFSSPIFGAGPNVARVSGGWRDGKFIFQVRQAAFMPYDTYECSFEGDTLSIFAENINEKRRRLFPAPWLKEKQPSSEEQIAQRTFKGRSAT